MTTSHATTNEGSSSGIRTTYANHSHKTIKTSSATTINTDGATLEISEVGDLDAILKMNDQALASGDIEAGQIVVVVWDGSNWQMTSQIAQ